MRTNSARLVVTTVEAIADDGSQWIEIMPTVEKDRNGPYYFSLTREDLETFAEDIRARPGQIPVDYDHSATGVGTKAAGWFSGEAEVRPAGDGFRLWALVKWTSAAVASIREGEWKRISPEFLFEQKDPLTGLMTKAKNLVAATLTNRPHFEQLAPVAAHLLDSSELDEFPSIFGADAAAAIRAALSGDVEELRAAAGKAKVTSKGEQMSVDLKKIAAELGLAEDADEEKVLGAVQAIKLSAAEALAARGTASIPTAALTLVGVPDHASEQTFLTAVRAKDERIAELEQRATGLQTQADQAVTLAKRVTELEKERDRDAITQVLREEVKAMRVLPSEVEQLAAQFADNPDGLKTLVNARPPDLFAHLSRPKGTGATRNDAEIRALGAQFGATEQIPLDEDGARLHVAAMEVLREKGKELDHSEAEYAAALSVAAARQPTIA